MCGGLDEGTGFDTELAETTVPSDMLVDSNEPISDIENAGFFETAEDMPEIIGEAEYEAISHIESADFSETAENMPDVTGEAEYEAISDIESADFSEAAEEPPEITEQAEPYEAISERRDYVEMDGILQDMSETDTDMPGTLSDVQKNASQNPDAWQEFENDFATRIESMSLDDLREEREKLIEIGALGDGVAGTDGQQERGDLPEGFQEYLSSLSPEDRVHLRDALADGNTEAIEHIAPFFGTPDDTSEDPQEKVLKLTRKPHIRR